jgi:hypothetical protein
MTKATNFLATVTDVNSEFPAKGTAIPNSNRCVIKDETGQTIGSVGATNNWYVDQSAQPFASYTSPRLPRWQDLVQTTTTTTTQACVPLVYDTPGGFGISGPTTAVVGNVNTGPFYTYTFSCSSTIPADYPFVMSIQVAGPVIVNYPGTVPTTYIIWWDAPGVLRPGYYDTRQAVMQAVPGYWRIGVQNACTNTLGDPDYFFITAAATTTTTSTSTTTTTSTSTTTTTTTLCPSCSYTTSIGTTTSCSGDVATKNVLINTTCVGNSEARLVAIGNGAITTGWVTLTSSSAIYSFTSTHIGTYRVEARGKSAVTTCPSSFISGEFTVCCNTSPVWTNTGAQYCDGCAIKQLQTDTNFCSSTYNTTQIITISASSSTCGTWGSQTQYCPNYGVYPFQLRTHEVNTCGQTRNDSLVTNLSPTCGYGCGYWGLSVTFSGYFCNSNTNGTGVVTINVGVVNGSYEARLVSTGAGTTTGWLAGNTFTGVYDGTYYAQVRSTSDNSCTASTVGTAQNYQTVSCCSTTPDWVDNGAAYCDNCVSKQPQIDIGPCSPTNGTPRTINSGNACNTTQNWQNSGNYNCYGTCNKYNVEIQTTPCASGYNTTRQGTLVDSYSTFCGGCCGQSTAPDWQNIGFTCVGCDKYYLQYDNNSCSSTPYPRTQTGDLVQSNSTYCGGCCGQGTAPVWDPVGSPYCDPLGGCDRYQNEVQSNPCCLSPAYGSYRDPVTNLGPNTACGSWYTTYYCPNYGVAPYEQRSRQLNTCVGGVYQNDQFVTNDSPSCGYVPPPTCKVYQIVAIDPDQQMDGVYINCSGFPDSFSFYGGPGTVGQVCAQPSSVNITSGYGYAQEVGNC